MFCSKIKITQNSLKIYMPSYFQVLHMNISSFHNDKIKIFFPVLL